MEFAPRREAMAEETYFDGIELHGLEPCFAHSGRCMNLQPNLYNHATNGHSDDRKISPLLTSASLGAERRRRGASGYAGRELHA